VRENVSRAHYEDLGLRVQAKPPEQIFSEDSLAKNPTSADAQGFRVDSPAIKILRAESQGRLEPSRACSLVQIREFPGGLIPPRAKSLEQTRRED
jgi:hypothetical protein